MNAMAFALVLPVAGGREQGAQQVKDGRVGELDPERGNVNDCALDEVLRRHNWILGRSPEAQSQRWSVIRDVLHWVD